MEDKKGLYAVIRGVTGDCYLVAGWHVPAPQWRMSANCTKAATFRGHAVQFVSDNIKYRGGQTRTELDEMDGTPEEWAPEALWSAKRGTR